VLANIFSAFKHSVCKHSVVCVCVCVYVCVLTHVSARIHTHTHAHTLTYIQHGDDVKFRDPHSYMKQYEGGPLPAAGRAPTIHVRKCVCVCVCMCVCVRVCVHVQVDGAQYAKDCARLAGTVHVHYVDVGG
jgi:hypothetical protein